MAAPGRIHRGRPGATRRATPPRRHRQRQHPHARTEQYPRIYLDSRSNVHRLLAEGAVIGSGVRISQPPATEHQRSRAPRRPGVDRCLTARATRLSRSANSDPSAGVENWTVMTSSSTSIAQLRRDLDAALAPYGLASSCPAPAAAAQPRTVGQRRVWQAMIERPSRATGTSRRSRTRPYATCHSCAAPRGRASWFAAGNSLMYVQRQLGHADTGTTERYYGHLERHVPLRGGRHRGRDRSRRSEAALDKQRP